MNVQKRNGNLEAINWEHIAKQTKLACAGLSGVSHTVLERAIAPEIVDGIPTTSIQNMLITKASNRVSVDEPNWTYVASRLMLYSLYHESKRRYFGNNKQHGDVYQQIKLEDAFLKYNKKYNLTQEETNLYDWDKLNKLIIVENDYHYNYLAMKSLMTRYLLSVKGEVVELPQHMLMFTAMVLAKKEAPEDVMYWTEHFYNVLSNGEGLLATPSLAKLRIKNGNCFSCAVGYTPDSIEGIFDSYKFQALGSKAGCGWGWDWSRVRASGSTIEDKPGVAGGVIPFLSLENGVTIAVNQLGVRLGAINAGLECWHLDIYAFIELKKDGGSYNRRAKELTISCSMSDEYMRRVDNDEDWTLFDPYDTNDLCDLHGDAFSARYREYERGHIDGTMVFANQPITIKAKDLWKKVQRSAFDTGYPFIFFKDTVNKDITPEISTEHGIVNSGNLCMEYLSPIPKDSNVITLCNLGSININKVNTVEDMKRVIPIMTRMLDNVIDIAHYAIPNSKDTQLKRRSIGLGVVGEGEFIANKGMMYGSEEHLEWIDGYYKMFSELSDQASLELGNERGEWSEGEGYRNMHRRAIAPTSSIAILMDTTNGHEPCFDKIWLEDNDLGKFLMTAPHINPDNAPYYINAYEVDQKMFVRTTAVRGKYIDMGISHSMYFVPEESSGKEIFDTYILAWKLGLKTTYYLRTRSAKANITGVEGEEVLHVSNEIKCIGCEG